MESKDESMWIKCPLCGEMVFKPEWERKLKVCPNCDYHFRIGAMERIKQIFENVEILYEDILPDDPLGFVDLKPYAQRLKESAERSGLTEALVAGVGEIGGKRVAFAVLDFNFMGGSMASVVGERFTRLVEMATSRNLPVVAITASGGARMQEGIISLMQMAKVSGAIKRYKQRCRMPYVVVLTDPTTGGVTASFATLGDFLFAEPKALIGFAGPRVIEQTTKQKLPEGFQRAEFLVDHGMIDGVVRRSEIKAFLDRLLSLWWVEGGIRKPEEVDLTPANPDLSAWDRVKLSRNPGRPQTSDYIRGIFEDFVELRGDRHFAEDRAIIAGIARIDGQPVFIIGQEKGKTTKEKLERNFGMARPEGYRKALRVMRLADRFGFPVITFVDTPGAYPGIGAEERGQGWAIAENLQEMFGIRVPIISVIIGEGGSGGALGIAVSDRILMLENSTYSVISPEGCAAILWRDASYAPQAAEALKLSAFDLKNLGVVDEIIPEPKGGAQNSPKEVIKMVGERIRAHLAELLSLPAEKLLEGRYKKYRSIGFYKVRGE